jgi:thiamine pyrophosphate-dependent acetolactate synthase large subunit-like protein
MPDPAAIDEAADRLAQAKRPLILVGGGAVGTRKALTAIRAGRSRRGSSDPDRSSTGQPVA